MIYRIALAGFVFASAAPAYAQQTVGDNHGRLPYHLDSWISLGLILAALVIAVLLNMTRAKGRGLGLALAGLSCLAVTIWYAWALSSGVIQDPRPASAPLDAAKPATLAVQAIIAAAAGAVLIFLGLSHSARSRSLTLGLKNEDERYGRVSRYLHWTIAILFIALIPMGVFTSMIPDDGRWYRQGYYVVHKTIGITLLGLVIARLVWNVVSPRPKLDAHLSSWEKRLAHGAHWALYGLMIAFPITGFMMSTYAGKLSHWFVWDTPMPFAPDDQAIIIWALLHKIVLPYVFYLLIAAHITGALKHRYLDKQNTAFTRMVA